MSNQKIKEIIDKYIVDERIRGYSNKHFNHLERNKVYTSIDTKEDVMCANNRVKNMIESCSNEQSPDPEDIIDLEKYIGEYEIAVSKVLKCYTNFDYTAEEIQDKIDEMFYFYSQIDKIKRKKLMF
ncbi:hypothetical protein ABIE66_002006 [Peribacillus sp. B2I2]|uniref:hypothetical protein n=1 Tax=Peribacillus sp. B2I2 TaxID=3156468 RepID=UPI003518754D